MILFAFLCIFLGVVTGTLYAILPFPVDYVPYTAPHVVSMLQLLLFSGLAFFICLPMMKRTLTISLDSDWFYRHLLFRVSAGIVAQSSRIHRMFMERVEHRLHWFIHGVFRHHGPGGVLARTWPTGSTVLWVAVLLALYMIFYFV